MTSTERTATQASNWNNFLTHLAEYVRLELSGEDADEVYPDIAFYIERSQACENAYYQEFRRQGLQKPLAELRRLGNREQVAGVMQQILNAPTIVDNDAPNPNWDKVVVEHGRILIDRIIGRWQQVQSALAGKQSTLALSGFMSAETSTASSPQAELHFVPEDTDHNIRLRLTPESIDQSHYCELEVKVERQDSFGDYSGTEVSIIREGVIIDKQTTDALGEVRFNNLRFDLADIEVQITLPV